MLTRMADVMIHISETLPATQLEGLRDGLLAREGVFAAAYHEDKPHLMSVEYDPERIPSLELLAVVTKSGLHAELVGL